MEANAKMVASLSISAGNRASFSFEREILALSTDIMLLIMNEDFCEGTAVCLTVATFYLLGGTLVIIIYKASRH